MPQTVQERAPGRFAAQVLIKGERQWLGTFSSEAGAKRAVAAAKKKATRRVYPPTVAEIDRLAQCMAARRKSLGVFVKVAAWSGLRLSEVAALEWRDVQARDGVTVLHVRHGKGDKERWSVLLPPGVEALGSLVSTRHPKRLLFVTPTGLEHTRKSINYHWTRARTEAGPSFERFRFHDLRKFNATWLLDHGVSDLDCAVQLGHIDKHGRPSAEHVRSTYGYVSLDQALVRVAGTMGC